MTARRVLVTGASRGIGRAVAEALLARGDHVALVARDRAALDSVACAAGGCAYVVAADLADPDAVDRVVARSVEALGGLDDLVSAAGIVRYQRADALRRADVEAQLAVNFTAPLVLSLRAAEAMRGGGAIVHVASTLAFAPATATIAYAASKAALVAATRGLALELAPRVRVNAVAPGVVDTDMIRVPRLLPGEREPVGDQRAWRVAQELETLRRLHPLERLGTAADIAQAVVYLLDAAWVTGTVLVVDGGLTLAG